MRNTHWSGKVHLWDHCHDRHIASMLGTQRGTNICHLEKELGKSPKGDLDFNWPEKEQSRRAPRVTQNLSFHQVVQDEYNHPANVKWFLITTEISPKVINFLLITYSQHLLTLHKQQNFTTLIRVKRKLNHVDCLYGQLLMCTFQAHWTEASKGAPSLHLHKRLHFNLHINWQNLRAIHQLLN